MTTSSKTQFFTCPQLFANAVIDAIEPACASALQRLTQGGLAHTECLPLFIGQKSFGGDAAQVRQYINALNNTLTMAAVHHNLSVQFAPQACDAASLRQLQVELPPDLKPDDQVIRAQLAFQFLEAMV